MSVRQFDDINHPARTQTLVRMMKNPQVQREIFSSDDKVRRHREPTTVKAVKHARICIEHIEDITEEVSILGCHGTCRQSIRDARACELFTSKPEEV